MSFVRSRIQTMLRLIGLGVAVWLVTAGSVPAAWSANERAPEREAPADAGQAIVGMWRTAPSSAGRATVRLFVEGGGLVGEIVALDQPNYPAGDPLAGQARIDRENPDPRLRSRPIIGLRFLEGFRFDGKAWVDGTIYDADEGKTYRCTIRHEVGRLGVGEDNTERLHVRGYVGISLLGRTTEWERVPTGATSLPTP